MGSYDGAEVCELVGLFLLHEINQNFSDGNMGLYRGDGLGTLTASGPEAARYTGCPSSVYYQSVFYSEVSVRRHCNTMISLSII